MANSTMITIGVGDSDDGSEASESEMLRAVIFMSLGAGLCAARGGCGLYMKRDKPRAYCCDYGINGNIFKIRYCDFLFYVGFELVFLLTPFLFVWIYSANDKAWMVLPGAYGFAFPIVLIYILRDRGYCCWIFKKKVYVNDIVWNWLDSIGLTQYYDVFVFNGYVNTLSMMKLDKDRCQKMEINKQMHIKLILMKVSDASAVNGGNHDKNTTFVWEWLHSIGLTQYYDKLIGNGYENEFDINTITRNDCMELGITIDDHIETILRKNGNVSKQTQNGSVPLDSDINSSSDDPNQASQDNSNDAPPAYAAASAV